MAQPAAGMQLTLLGGAETVDEHRLGDLYAYPDALTRCWVRSNFIASIDGAATAEGKSGGLGAAGDRVLFALMRQLADVIVVGAGTVRVENYGGAQMSVGARQARQARGQAEVPPIAIVTGTGALERDMKVFTHSEVVPLVLTSATALESTRTRLGAAAEVIDCSTSDKTAVDVAMVLAALADRGHLRVLTEGGPRLHGSFIEAKLLDELCLTVAPVLVGGHAPRITTGLAPVQTDLRRAHLLADDDGYLYARYVRTA
ncbi:pyrimidine reductase family protein [[Mycobacterium] burgundiense]|uniref:Pyrimidine reductase family protein n=1 Tax=[Mycobacterium] burgundiense TaxID=3064286 RepID=A0ABN9NG18_9MYCO|nr:pyrimidine reductase family protein [Mycolicibacterium sp. MU0053]CAJ1505749.1 pyrimidine reductase family protein [Mycolicibacterium sp. MU0053]